MSEKEKILLHNCCGPCTIYPLKALREEGFEVYGFFFNPNIHPYREYLRRRDTLLQYAEMQNFPVEVSSEYPFQDFLKAVSGQGKERCRTCYSLRLAKTAKRAKEQGYAGFSSTLLVSPFQDHALIAELGEKIGEKEGIPFIYRDFREGYKSAVGRAKQLQLYRQPYCGCIFSEYERFSGER
ncbi:MAG: epoxyqueuosine reductase QueH [Firmicutes bacterium]|nr:epoxyqueuosine reductase QueH [Bacillota bacterium]